MYILKNYVSSQFVKAESIEKVVEKRRTGDRNSIEKNPKYIIQQ